MGFYTRTAQTAIAAAVCAKQGRAADADILLRDLADRPALQTVTALVALVHDLLYLDAADGDETASRLLLLFAAHEGDVR